MLATNCSQLKMQSSDGKYYKTDVADTEQLFRLIQSIPSPKAEPFKLWLAEVAKQRLDQLQDPELSIEQAMTDYKRLGYSDNWIQRVYFLNALISVSRTGSLIKLNSINPAIANMKKATEPIKYLRISLI